MSTRPEAVIEVHVAELRQVFDHMDPAPFCDRDLDPKAVEYIVDSARELPRHASLALPGDAVSQFFNGRGRVARWRLKRLFRGGRVSLLIGLAFLVGAFTAGHFIGLSLPESAIGALLKESVMIGGWVAMWRPLEIFPYDWWPILAEARLHDRLAAMPLRIGYHSDTTDRK